jgi:hypothetical protein
LLKSLAVQQRKDPLLKSFVINQKKIGKVTSKLNELSSDEEWDPSQTSRQINKLIALKEEKRHLNMAQKKEYINIEKISYSGVDRSRLGHTLLELKPDIVQYPFTATDNFTPNHPPVALRTYNYQIREKDNPYEIHPLKYPANDYRKLLLTCYHVESFVDFAEECASSTKELDLRVTEPAGCLIKVAQALNHSKMMEKVNILKLRFEITSTQFTWFNFYTMLLYSENECLACKDIREIQISICSNEEMNGFLMAVAQNSSLELSSNFPELLKFNIYRDNNSLFNKILDFMAFVPGRMINDYEGIVAVDNGYTVVNSTKENTSVFKIEFKEQNKFKIDKIISKTETDYVLQANMDLDVLSVKSCTQVDIPKEYKHYPERVPDFIILPIENAVNMNHSMMKTYIPF